MKQSGELVLSTDHFTDIRERVLGEAFSAASEKRLDENTTFNDFVELANVEDIDNDYKKLVKFVNQYFDLHFVFNTHNTEEDFNKAHAAYEGADIICMELSKPELTNMINKYTGVKDATDEQYALQLAKEQLEDFGSSSNLLARVKYAIQTGARVIGADLPINMQSRVVENFQSTKGERLSKFCEEQVEGENVDFDEALRRYYTTVGDDVGVTPGYHHSREQHALRKSVYYLAAYIESMSPKQREAIRRNKKKVVVDYGTAHKSTLSHKAWDMGLRPTIHHIGPENPDLQIENEPYTRNIAYCMLNDVVQRELETEKEQSGWIEANKKNLPTRLKEKLERKEEVTVSDVVWSLGYEKMRYVWLGRKNFGNSISRTTADILAFQNTPKAA